MREDNPKKFETLAWKMFNKQYKDLTKEERKQYYTWRKQVEREKHPERKEKDIVLLLKWMKDNPEKAMESKQRWRKNNPDKVRQIAANNRLRNGAKPQTEGELFKMFGVHGYQNLTLEQKREYNRTRARKFYRNHRDEILGRNRK